MQPEKAAELAPPLDGGVIRVEPDDSHAPVDYRRGQPALRASFRYPIARGLDRTRPTISLKCHVTTLSLGCTGIWRFRSRRTRLAVICSRLLAPIVHRGVGLREWMTYKKGRHMKKALLALLAAGFGASALAASPPVGVVTFVQGNATITTGDRVQAATSGTPLHEGAEFLVASDGAATIQMNGGCNLLLGGGAYVVVHKGMTCSALQASVTQLVKPYQVASLDFKPYQLAAAPVGDGSMPVTTGAGTSGAGVGGAGTSSAGVGGTGGGGALSMTALGGLALGGLAIGGVIAVANSGGGSGNNEPISPQ